MDKEVKNIFFGEIHAFSVSSLQDAYHDTFTRATKYSGPEKYRVTIDIKDGQCCIHLKFDSIAFPALPDPFDQLNEGDLVQVTHWADETVTIERFNED